MTLMIILTVSLIFIGRYSCKHFDMLSDELIQYVNDHPASCWKASRQNRFKTATDVRNTLGYPPIQTSKYHNLPSVSYDNMDILLPDYFDSREHWDNCSSIKTIHDQSRCVSGWAVASASAISDRICIQTNGKSKPELSALDLISCCTRCRVGCQFGYPKFAWDYWVRSGIVTGDSKGAFSGCLPYPFPKCDHGSNHSHPLCGNITYEPPTCNNTCSPGYPVSYAADKHFGKFIYTVRKNESDIRKEIMLNGPVQASFLRLYRFPQLQIWRL
ncbi:unnamed protein product [Heterobilharzia americana]|nr:unnamed protein product [Heterobilharzia americana]